MSKSIKNAIVIGATGLVGKSLLKQLNDSSEFAKISAIVRQENIEIKKLKKVHQIVLDDFYLLNDEDLNGFTHAFSCLGTTIKKAGSRENFYAIDYEINAHFADLLQETEIHYLLVSAIGADSASKIFYNRTKGELEKYVQSLNLYKTSIFQPSLLIGERSEVRFLEDLSQKVFTRISPFIPITFKYKPVTAEQVAHTMVLSALNQTEKFHIYDNLQIHKIK